MRRTLAQPDPPPAAEPPRCAACGEVIGVYEPIVQVAEGVATETSRAAWPEACAVPAGRCFHEACWTP